MELIKNFTIGQVINFNNYELTIINYAGTTLYRLNGGVAEMQLYEINLNGEKLFASDAGILSNDPSIFIKIIAGVGYRGKADYQTFNKEYSIWKDMIYRIYNQNNKLYPYYGGIGITIDPRWLCFELFLYDFVNVQNYDKIQNKSSFVIDIKSKQKNVLEEERIYGPGKIAIKQYYKSDVYINTEKAKQLGINQDAGLCSGNNKDSRSQHTTKIRYRPLANGSYSNEAYDYTIHNPPSLSIPDNDDIGYNIIRTFNGVHYKDRPLIKSVCDVNKNK